MYIFKYNFKMGSCIANKQQIIVTTSKESENTFPHKTQTNPTNNTNNPHHKPKTHSIISTTNPHVKRNSKVPNYNELLSKANSFKSKIITNINDFKSQLNITKTFEYKNKILTNIITSTPNSDMICILCDDILLHPLHCIKCNLFICEHCFTQTKHQICDHIVDPSLNEYYANIKEMLSKLTFKCFNYEKGCDVVLEYNDMYYNTNTNEVASLHYAKCSFAPMKEHCTYINCTFTTDNIKVYKQHVYKCIYKEYKCILCDNIVKRNEVNKHQCVLTKNKALFLVPFRICKCGKQLKWITSFQNEEQICKVSDICNNNSHCVDEYYYYCSYCNMKYCLNHMPIPVMRVCGCCEKLKGGIIKRCSVCFKEGGIGWRCTSCEKRNEICEGCLESFNELQHIE